MKILNKNLSRHFCLFYKDVVSRLGTKIRFEDKPFEALGDCNVVNGVYVIRLDTKMNKKAFEHTAAHELLHLLQLEDNWPRTFPPSQLSERSWQRRFGSELVALVLDLNVEEKLK